MRRPYGILGRCALCATLLLSTAGGASAYDIETIGYRWKMGRAVFHINPNFPPPAGTPQHQIDLLKAAAASWRSQSTADFEFEYGGTTAIDREDSDDGVNAVFYSDEDGNGALAATFLWGVGTRFTAFDMEFYASTSGAPIHWKGDGEPLPGEIDIWGTAVHEFGHALGLGHSDDTEATMYEVIRERGLPLRILADDDRAGIVALYGERLDDIDLDPRIDYVTPAQGPDTGGGDVVIEGANFTWALDTTIVLGDVVLEAGQLNIETASRLVVTGLPPHDPGLVDVQLTNSLGSGDRVQAYEYVETSDPVEFLRGDANHDQLVALSDPVLVLFHLFQGTPLPCTDAADADDDGAVEMDDAVMVLEHLFLGGAAPAAPYPQPGLDPTGDTLLCR